MLSQNPHVMIRSESSVADLRGVSHDSFLDNIIFFNFMQILGKIWYWRLLFSLKTSNPPPFRTPMGNQYKVWRNEIKSLLDKNVILLT